MANEQFNTTVNVIKVVGVGGGGGNAVNRMMESRIEGVEYIAVNTDLMVLNKSLANKRIAIGERITKGQGAGANPELGEKAADESIEEITAALHGVYHRRNGRRNRHRRSSDSRKDSKAARHPYRLYRNQAFQFRRKEENGSGRERY